MASSMSGGWYREDILLDVLNQRADELLDRSEKQSDGGAHDLAKLTSFRAMGVVDAINAIRRIKGLPLPIIDGEAAKPDGTYDF